MQVGRVGSKFGPLPLQSNHPSPKTTLVIGKKIDFPVGTVQFRTVVGPPVNYQWLAGPQWLRCHETDSSVSTLVTSQGRLFVIVDEAPIGLMYPAQEAIGAKTAKVGTVAAADAATTIAA